MMERSDARAMTAGPDQRPLHSAPSKDALMNRPFSKNGATNSTDHDPVVFDGSNRTYRGSISRPSVSDTHCWRSRRRSTTPTTGRPPISASRAYANARLPSVLAIRSEVYSPAMYDP